MAEQCRAAVFPGDSTYEVREFDVPEPPPGGALLKVEAVGLCGSDVAQYQGIELVPGGTAFPVVPGHETVGRVVKLGAGAELGVAEGDRVAVDEILSQAPFRLYGYSDMTGEGKLGLWGGYGEYMEIFPGSELVTDHIVLKSLQLHGGAGFTSQSMADAVQLIESGAVRTEVVSGEVFGLDDIDEAMALLARGDPDRDAVRVGLRHSHGAAS
jgi:threonine dehydrogenase-like Zn-dependent dehydrogenase